jgi:hypothetical protein
VPRRGMEDSEHQPYLQCQSKFRHVLDEMRPPSASSTSSNPTPMSAPSGTPAGGEGEEGRTSSPFECSIVICRPNLRLPLGQVCELAVQWRKRYMFEYFRPNFMFLWAVLGFWAPLRIFVFTEHQGPSLTNSQQIPTIQLHL